jgi:hypothetical protein
LVNISFNVCDKPMGSSMVESACKWLIQQWFKGVGMRWSEDGFNHLLHLRLAWVNGRFDTLFNLALFPNSSMRPEALVLETACWTKLTKSHGLMTLTGVWNLP